MVAGVVAGVVDDVTLSSTVAGMMMGRNESECGQIGVISMQGTVGCTIEPPADTEYAVEPVGVAMMSPSPCTQVIGWPSQSASEGACKGG